MAVRISRGASYLITQTVISNVVLVVSFAILARLITPKEMGIWAILTFVASMSQTLVAFGVQVTATKFVAEEISQGKKDSAASVFYQCIRFTLLLAVPVSLAVFLGASSLSSLLLGQQDYSILFQIAALDILIFAGALPVLNGTMLGLQKFKETAVVTILVSNVFRQAVIITLVILLRNFAGLVIGWVVSDLATALVFAWYVISSLGRPRFELPLGRLLRFSWPLYFGNAAGLAQAWFDRVLLLAFVPLATLGVYNATIIAFGVLGGIAAAMASTLLPAYSAITGDDWNGVLGKACGMASRYACFFLVPLSLGLLAAAKPALTIFVGQAYTEGAEPLMVLSAVFALTAFITAALNPMLLALGKTRISSGITILSVLVGVVAAALLMPLSGMLGASIARGLAMIVSSALIVIVLMKSIRLSLDVKGISKILVAAGVMAAVVLVIQVPLYNRLLLPVYVLVGGGVYVLMLRLLRAVTEEDLVLIENYLGGRLLLGTRILRRALL